MITPILLLGQVDDLQPQQIELIEAFIEATEEEGELDQIDLYDQMLYYLSKPLNLNKADEEQMYASQIFRPEQIAEIIEHKRRFGDLISLHELQTMRSIDVRTILAIRPFVTVGDGLDNFNVAIGKMIVGGKNELILRWERFLQDKRGFVRTAQGEEGGYLGDANRYVVRYRHQYENILSFGISAEKDAGEEFFKGSNKQGFDFYSAHLFLNRYSKRLKYLALGDYHLRLGQGLTLYNGFASNKSAYVTEIKRGGYTLSPYRSVGDIYFRGAAATWKFGDRFEATSFFSKKKRDGNVFESDLLDSLNIDFKVFTSLQTSGAHRTEAEINDKGSFTETIYGGRLQGKINRFTVGVNGMRIAFDKLFFRKIRFDNLFDFRGTSFSAFSSDYSGSIRNVHLFGEVARSDNGGVAMMHGALLGMSQFAQLSLLYRKFDRDYYSLYANPFAQSSRPQNEEGLYMGLKFRPHENIFIEAFADLWRNPWLRFTADSPSNGEEFLVRIRYYKKRQTELYVQLRRITRDETIPSEVIIDPVSPHTRTQYRLHFSHKLSNSLTWRSRIEFINYSVDRDRTSFGYMVYQDFIFSSLSFPISFTTRFAIFDTDDSDSRLYAYENEILYSYSVRAYQDRGSRFYLNVRYKPSYAWTLEGRYEMTYLSNMDDFGSGNELIEGNVRSRLKAQVKYSF